MFEMALLVVMMQDPMPPLSRLETFGGKDAAFASWDRAKSWKNDVAKAYHVPVGDPFPSRWKPWCQWHYDEADMLYETYDSLTNAWCSVNYPDKRSDVRVKVELRRVRSLVGEQAYWSGHLPPVPVLEK